MFCLVFPAPCHVCAQPLRHYSRIPVCPSCLAHLPELGLPGCPQCGKASATADRNLVCLQCQFDPPAYDQAASAAAYNGSGKELVHLLKYNRVLPLAEFWAERLRLCAERFGLQADVIVPVPLGKKRQRQRGFNQSGEIARRLAQKLQCDYAADALTRTRETQSQAGLEMAARIENVAGAFLANPKRIVGRSVLLVDDVLTTGATARAASAALKRAGARKVVVLTATRADMRKDIAA
ncbi:MAG TPA: ComF family protein [Terriglobales bacterium]